MSLILFVIDSYVLKPDSIKIIGPKMVTDSILEIETKSLELDNVNSNFNNIIELNLHEKFNGLKISSIFKRRNLLTDNYYLYSYFLSKLVNSNEN